MDLAISIGAECPTESNQPLEPLTAIFPPEETCTPPEEMDIAAIPAYAINLNQGRLASLDIDICICNDVLVSSSVGSRLAEEMGRSCLNMRARLVSRVMTGLYDDELRPFGIKASQLNVLVTIAGMGPVRKTDVGRYMQLDTSTLSRNLRVMDTNGWIEEVDDATDGRGAPIRITSRGEALLAKVAPAWRNAQRRASRLIGTEGTTALREMASSLST